MNSVTPYSIVKTFTVPQSKFPKATQWIISHQPRLLHLHLHTLHKLRLLPVINRIRAICLSPNQQLTIRTYHGSNKSTQLWVEVVLEQVSVPDPVLNLILPISIVVPGQTRLFVVNLLQTAEEVLSLLRRIRTIIIDSRRNARRKRRPGPRNKRSTK